MIEIGNENQTIVKLVDTIYSLLEACDSKIPENCDCGGQDFCAVCDAWKTLKELDIVE